MPKLILLADDSSTIRKIVELTFSGSDIRVEAFESGSAALENWERLEPDLILADVVMPGANGYEVCRRIKSSRPTLPIVLLSSTFEPYDADLAAECGADRHLVKPFESATLGDTVRELLEPRTAVAEPVVEPVVEPVAPVEEEEYSEADDAVDALIQEPDDDEIAPPEQQDLVDDLDERLVDAVSKAVVRRLSEKVVREIAREVVPDLAERIIRERIRQLEKEDS